VFVVNPSASFYLMGEAVSPRILGLLSIWFKSNL
jgi:hypothetical protein